MRLNATSGLDSRRKLDSSHNPLPMTISTAHEPTLRVYLVGLELYITLCCPFPIYAPRVVDISDQPPPHSLWFSVENRVKAAANADPVRSGVIKPARPVPNASRPIGSALATETSCLSCSGMRANRLRERRRLAVLARKAAARKISPAQLHEGVHSQRRRL